MTAFATLFLPGASGAQAPLPHVAEQVTTRSVDSVEHCLERELKRYRPSAQRFTVVYVDTGSRANPRPARAATAPPRPITRDIYETHVTKTDAGSVVQVVARTIEETAGSTTTKRAVPTRREAKSVADKVAAKCAPGDP